MSREYFGRVISISRLRDALVGDRLVFDQHGDPVEHEIPETTGPAVLLVAPVTDAVKRVEARQVESLDRDGMWAVEAIVLDRSVLNRLGDDEITAEDLLSAVRDLGFSWEVSPISTP